MTKYLQSPIIRFSEFDDDWKISALGEVFSIINGYAFSSIDSQTSGCRWVKIADVGINIMRNENKSFLPLQFKEEHKKYVLFEGDYVVALTRPILQNKLKIARIDEESNGSLLNQRVGKIKSDNVLGFVYFLLQKAVIIANIENRIAGSDPPNLAPAEINSIKTRIPSLPEQQKIATFLSAVDTKIQQLQRKKELLEQYKKGVMQKIFSQEIRFKDEDGNDYPDWEEKRLGEFTVITKGKGIAKIEVEEDGVTECIRYGELYTTYSEVISIVKSRTNVELSTLILSQVNDVIIPSSGETHIDLATASYVPRGGIALGGDINIIKSDQDGIFMAYCLNNEKKHEIARLAQGSSVIHLYPNHLKELSVILPCLVEQKRISDLLSMVDKKIAYIELGITKIMDFKKGLLQQMFI